MINPNYGWHCRDYAFIRSSLWGNDAKFSMFRAELEHGFANLSQHKTTEKRIAVGQTSRHNVMSIVSPNVRAYVIVLLDIIFLEILCLGTI